MKLRMIVAAGLVAAFAFFDFVLHIFQCFDIYLIWFPTPGSYNIFWTVGWGVVFCLMCYLIRQLYKQ